MFNTATVTVAGLYLATHSVTVTLIGTIASTALTCWAMWLPYKPKRALDGADQLPEQAPPEESRMTPQAAQSLRL
jgi:hypothetical protein